MKTATFPSLRVDPALRQAAQDVLLDGESLSSFVEQSVRANIARRQAQEAFIKRGLASGIQAQQTGSYVSADAVIERLAARLAEANAKKNTA